VLQFNLTVMVSSSLSKTSARELKKESEEP
jgi:hypothetical protein